MTFNPHARMRDIDAQFEIDTIKVINIEFDGIDPKDAPDYCDAHIVSADYIISAYYKSRELSESEIDELNKDSEFVHEKLLDYLN